MSNEIGILYNKAQRMARNTGLNPKELEAITGEDRNWIYKFLNNDINDPGSKRLEGFVNQIKKYNAKKRKAK